MVKLLIADRDPNERTGIHWLVTSYPIPYDKVLTTSSFDETLAAIERETPQVLCVELDMIPRHRWEEFKNFVARYVQTTVVMTAEAVFERAMQAIGLHAQALWVKPISPDQIRRTLYQIWQRMANDAKEFAPLPSQNQSSVSHRSLSYRSLFIDEGRTDRPCGLMLLQPEDPHDTSKLFAWLQEYPFSVSPAWFQLSDTVVGLFAGQGQEERPIFQQEGQRLLREWHEQNQDVLSMVIHLPSGDDSLAVHHQYMRAKQALELRFFKGYQQLIWVADQLDWVAFDPFLRPEEQRDWIQMLQQADRKGIKAWMHAEFLNLREPYPDPGLLRIRLTSLLAQLRRYMLTYQLYEEPDLEAHYHRVFDSILYSPILYRIVQDLLLFIYELLERAERRQQLAATDVVERGVQYIEAHCHQHDLSLAKVARHVDRSPSYFSHLLSRKKGATFRDILTDVRIRRAQRELAETSLPIQTIADRAGFQDANYFSRIFRGKVGMSPRAYRDRKKIQKPNQHPD